MTSVYEGYLKGQFLIAMPELADPYFSSTVTCLCEHTHNGCLGVIVNRTQDYLTGKEIFDELQIEYTIDASAIPIYYGGPVHIGEVFILHGPPLSWTGSLEITPNLALSNTLDIVNAIATGKGPKSFLFALGCAGWAPDQLESEIKKNAWLTSPIAEDIIFDVEIEQKWDESIKRLGIDPGMLSGAAGHA